MIRYGVDAYVLTFIQTYFSNRQQGTELGDKFNKWQKVLTGVPQGFILGSVFLNIFINDLFLFIETTQFVNYEDDNTMYSSDKTVDIVISRLRHDFTIIAEWFYEDDMVLNAYKCHFLSVSFNEPFPDFLSTIRCFVYKNPLYKNHKAQRTLKIKNFLKNMVRLIFSHSKFPYCHHIISSILSGPVYCPSKI